MSELRLYDTLARAKRVFEPADPNRVTMYVCGPTVYGRAHIGNARPAVVFDVLDRLLRHQFGSASILHARNITDVDDKIIAGANREGISTEEVTRRYEAAYLDDMRALGVRDPDLAPHAVEHIPDMVAMIERLVASGNAYEAEGHVLFAVASDPDYGALSRRDRDAMLAGARVEVAPYKRDGADFVLWKPAKPGEPAWDSRWGPGRPGWHIECSAMIGRHLGETVDIHGGGLDLVFPHHENELAQSRCVHGGAPLARYWLHNGMLNFGAAKMSKSVGNIALVSDLLAAGHRGETLRLALLSAHYRQPLEWTDALIAQSKATLDRLYRAAGEGETGQPDGGVMEALADDLNTPLALSRLSAVSEPAKLKGSAKLLGLLDRTSEEWFKDRFVATTGYAAGGATVVGVGAWTWDETYVEQRIAERAIAKTARNFAEADRIRAELATLGVLLEDTSDSTNWRRA